MRRYEVSDERSNKFWEISLQGCRLQIRFGRIGSSGQRREKEFESVDEARTAHQRAINEKLGGGYKLVYDDDLVGGAPASASSGPDARNLELEAAILADPEDDRPYLVYGDWLQAQQDPRGELVSLQHALRLEKEPGRFLSLRKSEQALLKEHADYLLGPLLPHLHHFRMEWRIGFICSARLAVNTGEWPAGDPSPVELLEMLLSLPSARFLQELGFRAVGLDAKGHEAVWARLAELALPKLAGLSLGEAVVFETGPQSHLGDLSPLIERLPGLRRLRVGGRGSFSFAPLRELRLLELAGTGPELVSMALGAELPCLERLVLRAEPLTVEQLRPLLEAARMPALRQLALRGTLNTDALCASLAPSPLLHQLENLDLSGGKLTDEGATVLIRSGHVLGGLKLLDLSENNLSTELVERLRGLCKGVRSTFQRRPPSDEHDQDDDDRYDEIRE